MPSRHATLRRPLSVAALAAMALIPATASLYAELRVPVDVAPPPGRPNTIVVPGATGGPSDTSGAQPAAATAATPDVLFFLNGDKLRGKLLQAVAADNTLRWNSTEAKQDISFMLPGLKEVLLGESPGKTAPALAEGSYVVTLKNGDELPGTVVTLDDKTLVLDTVYAGTLKINRDALAGMVPIRGAGNLLFEGPKDMEGWETQQGARNTWRYKDGALISTRSGFTGRDFKLPDMSTIEFDVSWTGQFSLGVSIYTDELKGYGGNSYMAQIGNGYIYVSRMSRNGGQNQLGQAQVESMQRKNSARIRLQTNKEQKAISLYVDDALIRTFKDTGNFAGGGTGISFYNQSQGLIRIRRLRVSKWDGRVTEESPSATAKGVPEDTLILANQDKITGKLTAIKDGKVMLESPYATLSIPMQRIDVLTFATPEAAAAAAKDKEKEKEKEKEGADAEGKKKQPEAAEAPQPDAPAQPEGDGTPKPIPSATSTGAPATRQPGEVGVHLVGRGRITIKLDKWEADKLTGTGPSMGNISILPHAVKLLRFGPEPAGGANIPSATTSEDGDGDGEGEDALLMEEGGPINQPVFRVRR
ncbi:hypothetical protein DB346_13485 [Verrucomicrobia bacterium LW23]|nr:hypothetical protein DB346_13485 [Verrucomicrobia bacterium LW23]